MYKRIRLFTTDTLVDGNFRITTATRINPEAANAISKGDMGVTLMGNPGSAPKQVDIDRMVAGYEQAHVLGMLTRAEANKLIAQARRLNAGVGAKTGAAGITTAFDSTKKMHQELAVNENFAKNANDFWAAKRI